MVMSKPRAFPVTRRPALRQLSTAPPPIIEEWFQASGITIGSGAASTHQQNLAKRLFYTWKDCFAYSLSDIKPTDLLYHSIDITPGATPVCVKQARYNQRERAFSAKIFPEMEQAGILLRGASDWAARTLFPPKKKGSDQLRVVHNFIPINAVTIKPQYPMHQMEEVLDTVIKSKWKTFFSADASNGYWAIPIQPGDEHKAGITTPHGQYMYLRMGQGLKGAPHTYSQFTDLVFGPLPASSISPALPSIIGNQENSGFSPFMDDHLGGFTDFNAQFDFLHQHYFPRIAFGPVYLSGSKTFAFMENLELIGFTGSSEGLRPSVKHLERMNNWPTPKTKQELDAFIWITPFLRMFIPGRAELVLELKKAYLHQVSVVIPGSKGKLSVRKKWVEKEFVWTLAQETAFKSIKRAISKNAMAGADHSSQFHLATDASLHALGGVLFQLSGIAPGTEASKEHRSQERIVMFLSFRLSDAETRYNTTEREALAVVRCLAEVRWLVMGSPYPTKLYTDHTALVSILKQGGDAHGRISRWQDRLTEYDLEIHHRPGKSHTIGIADGLSRMPTRFTSIPSASDSIRLGMTAIPANMGSRTQQAPSVINKWKLSKWYQHISAYLKDGILGLQEFGLGANQLKRIRRLATQYHFSKDGQLWHRELNKSEARCVLEKDVPTILHHLHDEYGHFSDAITMDRARGSFWWPTRAKDVADYCRSCNICQQDGTKRKSTQLKPVIRFAPLDLFGLDFVGPISPACQLNGDKYVLVGVDYFSRFTWTQAYTSCSALAVLDFLMNKIAPLVGWPRELYTDNGTHFTAAEVAHELAKHGVTHYKAPITHPSSVGLSERNVQLVTARIRAFGLENDAQGITYWSTCLPAATVAINTRLMKVHGHTPAELLLGFNPVLNHLEPALAGIRRSATAVLVAEEELSMFKDFREYYGNEAMGRLTHNQEKLEDNGRQIWTPPVEGDLVVVRRHIVDAHHGKKLEPRWTEPRRLIKVSHHGRSGLVAKLHGDGQAKRFHLDDIKVYHERPQRLQLRPAT